MKTIPLAVRLGLGGLFILTTCLVPLLGQSRFQLEIYGGLSFLNPRDLNLLSKAEEQYNRLIYIERHFGWQGYFINDFPKFSSVVPAGVRVKCHISKKFAVSLEAEGFRKTRETFISGSFTYAPSWSLTETKAYAPYRLNLQALTMMGGLHYQFNVGHSTSFEIGAAAGWTRAKFDFRSSWAYSIDLVAGEFIHASVDGGTLQGDGRGNGFSAKAMLRFNRTLGRGFGFFAEISAAYCRLKSIRGKGLETRLGIPGETTWEGSWGIKREDMVVSGENIAISVPTNYWEGWTAAQRLRDFVLNLSSPRLIMGFFIRF